MKNKMWKILGVVIVIVVILAACAPPSQVEQPSSATEAPAAPTATTQAGPIRGGTLNWSTRDIPQKIDPAWSINNADWNSMYQVLEGLTRVSAEGEIEPALAKTWEISDDGLTYTFHLRPEAKFSTGAPVTADDVLASFNRTATIGICQWTLAEVTKYEKVDDATVKLTLDHKIAAFIARLAVLCTSVLPKSEVDAQPADAEFEKLTGTGPFVITEWIRGDHIILEKNPYYWEIAPDGKPYPYLDKIVMTQVPEDQTRVLQVQAGTAHGTEEIPWSQISALKSDTNNKVILSPSTQSWFYDVLVENPPLNDLKVRQAMSLALDRQALIDVATAGTGTIANSFFSSADLCWNADLSLPYDLEAAKKLMAESAYPDGYKGLVIRWVSGRSIAKDTAVLAQQMWAKIGLEFTLEEVGAALLDEYWYKHDYDVIAGFQWTERMADPEELVLYYVDEPQMETGWFNQQALDLARAGSTEMDPTKRCELYKEVQKIFNDDVGGIIPIFYTPALSFVGPKVMDYFRDPLGAPWYRYVWLTQ